MKDMFLLVAGGLGMLIAIAHGYIGETKVVRPVQGIPGSSKRVLQAIMFLSAVYWFVASLVLIATPTFFAGGSRTAAAYSVAAIFVTSAIANLWATRGRHFGWLVLTTVCVLAIAGA